jgi:DinB superfamily
LKRTLARLDSTHRGLLDLVGAIDEERFTRRPSENEWSVAEVVHHLSLVEQYVINSLEQSLARPPQRLPMIRRLIPTRIVASRLLRVKAPKGVQPLNPPPKEQLIENFNATRARLKSLCAEHDRARLRQVIFKHPFLGPIDGTATISFVGYHELRHYKQIREVLKKLNSA